ncbi:aminopeptidase [bacterium]|nr:aminopeptidase [bacterium]
MFRIHLKFGGLPLAILLTAAAVCSAQVKQDLQEHFPQMVTRIVAALQPTSGEHALIRFDPTLMPGLPQGLKAALEPRHVTVDLLEYGPAPAFEARLNRADIYIWLPEGSRTRPAAQMQAFHDWLAAGKGRQIHFHWGDGTRGLDGLNMAHNAVFDSVYLAALDVDYSELDRVQDSAIAKLKSGEIRVTTPAGTDIRFRIGDRPVTKQNGDASQQTASKAKAVIGRETELPAGAVRVAPLEESVHGTIVLPSARFGDRVVNNLTMTFEKGKISRFTADSGADAFRTALSQSSALNYFRELGIGFNPKLKTPKGQQAIPYYGYGAGIVRLSLGNNEELGGAVRGSGVRWLLFEDATVTVGETVIVRNGKLQPMP